MARGEGTKTALDPGAPRRAGKELREQFLEQLAEQAYGREGQFRLRLNETTARRSGRRAGDTRRWYSVLDRDGEKRGGVCLTLYEPHGRLWLEIGSVSLERSAQGQGFARSLVDSLRAQAPALGVSDLVLLADHDGAFSWSRLGFGFRWLRGEPITPELGASQARRMLRGREEQIAGLVSEGRVSAELAEQFKARFNDGESELRPGQFTSPAEIAAFGEEASWQEDGRELWLGKVFLLENSWDAVLPLERSER